ncbi:hypothetical protein BDQ94DRAFT_175926 [Aspergillus welwitschiae]|uniref:Uncharacterized protein n=1 Tax=Aspergillus welwitschiae TaxID=1341132 RepID=A0A3F3PJJ5_9EURO|nr:hypothetical protein BDQ94DRAFT_175926 [Aspergillus welwitschiae]RDH27111.1 hypothetical protein BDQ94DRAFT_175926 [Aspergillus welwitschiae]
MRERTGTTIIRPASAAKRAVRRIIYFLYKIKAQVKGRGPRLLGTFILACSRFVRLCWEVLDKMIVVRGSTPEDKITASDSIISDPQAIRCIAEFMLQTGLLEQFSQVELDPDPDAPDQSQEHVGLRAKGIDAEEAG